MNKWQHVKLGDIASNIQTGPFGSQLHQSDYSEIGIPVVMPKDLIEGKISEQSIARVESSHVERLSKHKIQDGDILYSRRGDVGRCAYATAYETNWLCGTGCLRVTIDSSKAISKFIFYQLQTSQSVGWVEKHAVGSTMLNLNTSILANIPLSLPPIEVQRKIADILSAYDDLIENNRKQIKLLEEAAQRLYKEWFIDLRFPGHENTKIIDGIPEGWEKCFLGDIAFESGKTVKKEYRNNYECYLPIDYLPSKSLVYTEYNDISFAESSLFSFNPSDIIFGAMRPYFHKVIIAYNKGLTRSTCFVLNSCEKSLWGFLVMTLFSNATIEYATQISVGTTMPYVRWKDFQKMPVLVPNKLIAQQFNNKFTPISQKLIFLAQQNKALQTSRDCLLPKLMNGELEVNL